MLCLRSEDTHHFLSQHSANDSNQNKNRCKCCDCNTNIWLTSHKKKMWKLCNIEIDGRLVKNTVLKCKRERHDCRHRRWTYIVDVYTNSQAKSKWKNTTCKAHVNNKTKAQREACGTSAVLWRRNNNMPIRITLNYILGDILYYYKFINSENSVWATIKGYNQ